jgi:hypothetical protein
MSMWQMERIILQYYIGLYRIFSCLCTGKCPPVFLIFLSEKKCPPVNYIYISLYINSVEWSACILFRVVLSCGQWK